MKPIGGKVLLKRLKGGALTSSILVVCALVFGVRETRAQSTALPTPWLSQDIGNPAVAGSASVSAGTWTVAGSGTNIGGQADQFRFAYYAITGDVDISARMTDFDTVNDGAKAGVMIREGLAADARNAFMLMSPGIDPTFQRRTSPGGNTRRSSSGTWALPAWVRLVRQGNLFTAYRSTNGTSWTTVGSATIDMTTAVYVGLAVTSRDAGLARATFTNLNVIGPPGGPAPGLPNPWANRDIGAAALTGSASFSAGTFTINAAGRDIWDASDQFHYVYQPVQGDTEIVARVTSLQQTNAWSKAGVMIRETLSAGSRHTSMFATGSSGWAFQYRDVADGISFSTAGPSGLSPGWVRLVRAGNLFSAYHSTDGSTWSLVGTDTIAMASTVYVGVAVTSHSTTTTAAATFTNVAVSTPSPGANQPPTVSLTSPATGATYTAPASMSMAATASDPDGTVARVDFYQGSTLIGSDTSGPYSMPWSGVAAGSYQLTAVAVDDDGASRTSAPVNVTVNSATNQLPTVSISAPVPGAAFTAGASITIQATASDSDGTVTRVEFYRGSTFMGSDSASPYAFTWGNAAAGTYTLTARAIDNSNATGTSAGVNITVNSAPNQLPTVSITSPASGTAFTAPASITMNANASDPDGTVTGVDFYVGSQLIATDTSSPYSAAWSNVGAGSYSLTAVARDNSGGTRTSAAVSVTVSTVSTPPTRVVFVPSADHATNVTSYTVALYRASDPVTASPVATRDLGKPAIVSGEISVDISTLVNPLPAGSYYAVVRASGSGGTTASAPSAAFTK